MMKTAVQPNPTGGTTPPQMPSLEVPLASMPAVTVAVTPASSPLQAAVLKDDSPSSSSNNNNKKRKRGGGRPRKDSSSPKEKTAAKTAANKKATKPTKPKKATKADKKPKGKRYASKQVDKWKIRYEEAKTFAKKNGHCMIPNEYPPNPLLGGWAKRQRYQYQIYQKNNNKKQMIVNPDDPDNTIRRISSMSPERIMLLEEIGFCWHHKGQRWLERYNELLEFIQRFGHAAVPTTYMENQSLAGWVKVQRRQYRLFIHQKKSSMSLERVALLNKVGFIWSIKHDDLLIEVENNNNNMEIENENENDLPTSTTTTAESEPAAENLLLLRQEIIAAADPSSSSVAMVVEQDTNNNTPTTTESSSSTTTTSDDDGGDTTDCDDNNASGDDDANDKIIDEKEAVLALLSFGS
mmetsp:Transcript_27037/g.65604  ORF Transcript_27037/g.65604 Transcript_27037/m.65604 type:complete len:408 (-) Transcript_27037:154-1377(-)